MPEQMFTFLGSQNHFYPPDTLFWDTLYSNFSKNRNFLISLLLVLDSHGVTDFENKYDDKIRILWPLLPGAMKYKFQMLFVSLNPIPVRWL